MGGERASGLAGSRVKIVDGHGLEASEPRIKELRQAQGRAWPGKSLVVYEPAPGLVTDVLPCKNGHAQERSLCGPLLHTGQAGELWMEDRNFCPRAFLWDLDNRGACVITREQRGFTCELLGPLRSWGRTETGVVAQQHVTVVDHQGHAPLLRRVRIKLHAATRDGATIVHILTN